MSHLTSPHHDASPSGDWNYWGGFAVLLIIAAFFLWTEHRAHVLGVLPFLVFLACPLIHLFMHRGHGRRGDHHES